MSADLLLSTAYLPPSEYFERLLSSGEAFIEREENYIKQSYRNRCYILSSSGPQPLSVPVYLGSLHKTPAKDIRIDYTKRWQQVHLGAIRAAYSSSPYFLFYFEQIESVILRNHEFLLDLNMELLSALLKMLKIECGVRYTSEYIKPGIAENDFRYSVSPKKDTGYRPKAYQKVFECEGVNESRLSIIDLLFSQGPDSARFL